MAQTTNDTKPCTDVQAFDSPEFGSIRALLGMRREISRALKAAETNDRKG